MTARSAARATTADDPGRSLAGVSDSDPQEPTMKRIVIAAAAAVAAAATTAAG